MKLKDDPWESFDFLDGLEDYWVYNIDSYIAENVSKTFIRDFYGEDYTNTKFDEVKQWLKDNPDKTLLNESSPLNNDAYEWSGQTICTITFIL